MSLDSLLYKIANYISRGSDDGRHTLYHLSGTLNSLTKHYKDRKLISTCLIFDPDVQPNLSLNLFSVPIDVPLEFIGKKIWAEEFFQTSIRPFYYKGYIVECRNENRVAIVMNQWELGKYFDRVNRYEQYSRL